MKSDTFTPFAVLRAVDPTRAESINAGVILFMPDCIQVAMASTASRLKALHPDYAALDLSTWATKLETAANSLFKTLPDMAQRLAMLPLLCHPFIVDSEAGTTQIDPNRPELALEHLLTWQVNPRAATVRARRSTTKRPTRLGQEIQQWLRSQNAFSRKMEDLSRHRVVSDYPVAVNSGLYADFAVSNGALTVLEVLDLRHAEHLTPSMRGDAALKGITLDAASGDNTVPIAIVAANDYGIAKPAISLMQRYAKDTFDLGSAGERDRFAAFMAKALHREDMLANIQVPGSALNR